MIDVGFGLPFVGKGNSMYDWNTLERDVKQQSIKTRLSVLQYFDSCV